MARGIKIDIDLKEQVVQVNNTKIAFDQLGSSLKDIQKAVMETNDANAGSVKFYMRLKQVITEISQSLDTNNKNYRNHQQILSSVDAKIKQLTDTRKKEEVAIDGSVAKLRAQVAQMRQIQANLSTTNKEYLRHEKRINNVEKAINRIVDTRRKEEKAIKGSANYIRQQIRLLEEEQQNRKKSNNTYRQLEKRIQKLNKELQQLTNTQEEHEVVQDGSVASIERQIRIYEEYQRNVATTAEEVQKYQKLIDEEREKVRALTKDTSDLDKAMEKSSSSAGAAGSTATELGRVFADLPYGIQGVANNIEQLSQQFVDLTRKEGGFKKALISLKNTLLGPAGIVVAVQLITMALVTYSKRQKDAERETSSLKDSLVDANVEIAKLRALAEIAQDGTASLEEQKGALKELKDKGFDPATQSLNEFITAQEKLITMRALQNAAEEQLKKLEQERLDTLFKMRQEYTEMIEMQEASGVTGAETGSRRILNVLKGDLDKIDEQITFVRNSLTQRIKAGFGLATAAGEGGEGGDDVETIMANSIAAIEGQIAILDSLRSRFAETNEEYQMFTDQIEELEGLITAITHGDREIVFPLVIGDPEFRGIKTPAQMLAESVPDGSEIANLIPEEKKKSLLDTILGIAYGDEDGKIASRLQILSNAMQGFSDIINAQAEREIAIETNKTNALNEQLRERIRNEQLSATERDKINQEIAKNDAELVKKQNEINKKRFEQEKIANISTTLINTFTAAIGAAKDTPGGPVARLLAASVVTAAGLANVAAIANQEFVPKATNAPSLTSQVARAESTGPQFNVVGPSQLNQLAETITQTMSSPVKAYVVSSDVTSAQELDRKIVEGAAI